MMITIMICKIDDDNEDDDTPSKFFLANFLFSSNF